MQLGDDLWPHWKEGSEKPMTKDFQFIHLNLIVDSECRDQQEVYQCSEESTCVVYLD